jgi:hypothetical protein
MSRSSLDVLSILVSVWRRSIRDSRVTRPHGFRFADLTEATVLRILENTCDPDHLVELHGLNGAGTTGSRMVDDPDELAGNGPPIAAQAWLGAELKWWAPRPPTSVS